jgi:hypothetical protein
MSVRPTSFDNPDGTWTYVHDDARPEPHGGTLDPATVVYGQNIDGSPNYDAVIVPCPFEGCGSVSTWPPGGGADALMGQSMHVLKAMESDPGLGRAAKTVEQAAAEVKARVVATDGEERWILDDAAMSALEARARPA